MAERLGMGLQNLVQRFESAWYLINPQSFLIGDFFHFTIKYFAMLLLTCLIYRDFCYPHIPKALRFSENFADLFFLLLRHKFSSIAYVTFVNFHAEKRKKKKQKIQKPKCFEYRYLICI
jgi:hypothetical protein